MADPDSSSLARTIARLNEISNAHPGEPPRYSPFRVADIKEMAERLSQLEDERKDQATEEAQPDSNDSDYVIHPETAAERAITIARMVGQERLAAKTFALDHSTSAKLVYERARIRTDTELNRAIGNTELLTDDENEAITMAGQLWNLLVQEVVGNGPTRESDLAELMGHIHAIQQAVMAQAAVRAYPGRFRTLGGSRA